MKRIFIFLMLVFLTWQTPGFCKDSPPSSKSSPFVMAMIRPEYDYLGKCWRMIYTEMFRRLGIQVEFRDYPSKRAAAEIDEGRVDGEPGRIKEYADSHPNLIRVDEPLFALNFSAFASTPSVPRLKSWADLRGKPFNVSYNRGIRICELNLPKVVDAEKLSSVTDPIQGIRQLMANYIDIYVDEESGVLTLLNRPEFRSTSIRIAGVLESAFVYPYVHKKHADLAPRMFVVLKAMKAEGLIEKYHKQLNLEFGAFHK